MPKAKEVEVLEMTESIVRFYSVSSGREIITVSRRVWDLLPRKHFKCSYITSTKTSERTLATIRISIDTDAQMYREIPQAALGTFVVGRRLRSNETYRHKNGDVYDWSDENVEAVRRDFSHCGKKRSGGYNTKAKIMEQVAEDNSSIPKPKWVNKKIPCMECRKDFISTWEGNRHCPRCAQQLLKNDNCGDWMDSDSFECRTYKGK